MYRIDFVLFMHIDIRQTGRDLVEKCDVCGTVSIPDSVLLRLLIPDVKSRFFVANGVELEDWLGGAYSHPAVRKL